MKSLQDALYNWLTIKVVADARPNDQAARETERFFAEILKNDFQVTNLHTTKDETMYFITYEQDEQPKTTRFPAELIEVMLEQINSEPEKYANYPT
ncbi:hypothetical protein B0I26_101170 [Anoxybacillus vitaminiphilus]|jgi:hypothetical protein|uniref:Uncharacterized protein n=1 Tax=Paranoxybacillus vitaminiphilus TaxID=581036 RepID=A0A327YSB2_9BACL|nr:hypothetical protein [Anoxybacillus vitaminiphilus]RAK23216.1 hypothetical protein B0I26_101170 [Anoxybacillus vitaminiphilus]